jgi:hypothetical protein
VSTCGQKMVRKRAVYSVVQFSFVLGVQELRFHSTFDMHPRDLVRAITIIALGQQLSVRSGGASLAIVAKLSLLV